jgi:hypothetical protein
MLGKMKGEQSPNKLGKMERTVRNLAAANGWCSPKRTNIMTAPAKPAAAKCRLAPQA